MTCDFTGGSTYPPRGARRSLPRLMAWSSLPASDAVTPIWWKLPIPTIAARDMPISRDWRRSREKGVMPLPSSALSVRAEDRPDRLFISNIGSTDARSTLYPILSLIMLGSRKDARPDTARGSISRPTRGPAAINLCLGSMSRMKSSLAPMSRPGRQGNRAARTSHFGRSSEGIKENILPQSGKSRGDRLEQAELDLVMVRGDEGTCRGLAHWQGYVDAPQPLKEVAPNAYHANVRPHQEPASSTVGAAEEEVVLTRI